MATAQRVIRVRQRETIADPAVKALIMRAVERANYHGPNGQDFYDEVARRIAEDGLGVFVGFDDGAPKAGAVVTLPTPLTGGPNCPIAYSESRALSRKIGERVRDWLKNSGHDRAFCSTRRNTAAFCRAFRHVGEVAVVGSVLEVRL